MAVLGLRFCARAFSSCGKWGPLFIAVRGPLTIAGSPVAEHRLQTRRLSNCGSRAQPLRGMWDLPRPGLEPVSPALAGRFSTTAPPGKPHLVLFESAVLGEEELRSSFQRLFSNEKKWTTNIYATTLKYYTKRRKAVRKDHMFYDSFHMECLRNSKSIDKEKQISDCLGVGIGNDKKWA